jgi:SAM-dependent methyltransferase
MSKRDIPDSAPSGIYTGAVYFERINSRESIRRIRSAFQDLVLRTAAPGAALFDFGAGPGIDARFFAERGYTVDAYDVDPKMREFFAEYCKDFIDSGRITLDHRGYREFLRQEAPLDGRPVDLVISNFAPLNQIDDLHELFSKFHSLTRPGAKLLVSVLNPCYIGDMKTLGWWRTAPRLWRDGHLAVSGGRSPPHTRRRLAEFGTLCAPYFVLSRVFRGTAPRTERQGRGIDMIRGARFACLPLASSEFMTLLFEKRSSRLGE